MILNKEVRGPAQSWGVRPWESYLEEHVLLAGGQVHLVLIVVHTDVDDVSQ